MNAFLHRFGGCCKVVGPDIRRKCVDVDSQETLPLPAKMKSQDGLESCWFDNIDNVLLRCLVFFGAASAPYLCQCSAFTSPPDGWKILPAMVPFRWWTLWLCPLVMYGQKEPQTHGTFQYSKHRNDWEIVTSRSEMIRANTVGRASSNVVFPLPEGPSRATRAPCPEDEDCRMKCV